MGLPNSTVCLMNIEDMFLHAFFVLKERLTEQACFQNCERNIKKQNSDSGL